MGIAPNRLTDPSFLVGLALGAVGSVLAVWDGLRKRQVPH